MYTHICTHTFPHMSSDMSMYTHIQHTHAHEERRKNELVTGGPQGEFPTEAAQIY